MASGDVILECTALGKVFRSYRRRSGLAGVLRNFFNRECVEITALAQLDIAIRAGEFVGLIGSNGAGKTTLVKCATGIIPASSGGARLFGCDSFHLRDEHKRRLSLVMGQRSQLWWDLPALDSFKLLAEIYGVERVALERGLNEAAQRLGVLEQLSRPLRQLSLGERMKMEIIGAFLHQPDVVFLDEPTIGLDIASRETIRRFLVELNRARGTTIVLTSHDMEDIEETCRRLLILRQGRVVFDGDLVELQRRVHDRREVVVHLEPSSRGWDESLAPQIAQFGAVLERSAPLTLTFSVDANDVQRLVPRLFELLRVRDLSIERQPLERLIREIFAGAEVASK